MVSVYAVLGPQAGVTTTGAHQVGIDFSGHLGLVREVDGRAGRHDAPPGAVYVTGRSPITWLEVSDPTEALEIYPDRALVSRLAGDLRGTLPNPGEVRPSFAEPDGVVFAVASQLRQAHLDPEAGALTDIEASTLAHRLAGHLLRRYGAGPPGERRHLVSALQRLSHDLLAGRPGSAEDQQLHLFASGTVTPTSASRVMIEAGRSSLQPSVPAGRIGTTT